MAFRTKKISQMDPKGSNLASTDLLEISQLVSGSYVTKSITGAEIISGATTGFVPTSRTLTINGTTQDLSADRTFTISTGITIGTTAITSGTVGRVLFEGTGNVVQESANLFWDNTNSRLGVGIAIPTSKLHVKFNGALTSGIDIDSTAFNTNHLSFSKDGVMRGQIGMNDSSGEIRYFCGAGGYYPTFWSNNTERMRIQASTGNVGINTATDAGFKLDVNGTARVQGALRMATDVWNGFGTYGLANFSGSIYIKPSLNVYIQNSSGADVITVAGNSVGIFQTSPNASARLQVDSTTKGFLPPRMTTTQKNAIASPATGLMVYDTTLNVISFYNGTMWV
jgi:hypothetical protein